MVNYYKILGIEENASKKDIIQAFKEKSLLHHPDKGGDAKMMQMIVEAKATLIGNIENVEHLEDYLKKLDDLLREKIPENIDYPDERIATKFREQHASLVEQFAQESIEVVPVHACFKKFESDLYYNKTFEGEEVIISDCKDLFDFIACNNLSDACEELEELSKTLTPKNAIEIFKKFIKGECFGNILVKAQQFFANGLTQIRDIDPAYNLYTGILEILNITNEGPEKKLNLLKSLNKITNFIRESPEEFLSCFATLLQSVHFRVLFSQALHLFWQQGSNGLSQADLSAFNNLTMTRNYLIKLAKQVLDDNEDLELLKLVAYIKKLYKFEQFAMEATEETHTADFYREHGFSTLNWLTVLKPYASRKLIANIFMQAGIFFQQASCYLQENVSVRKADERLALNAYVSAIAFSQHDTPYLEMYTCTNCLKFIAAFNYQDDYVKELIDDIQTRALLLADIFPLYIKLQSNIDFLHNKDRSIEVMRNLLHFLVAIIKQNGSNSNKIPIDHEYVTILYQAYEACIKSWYKEYYDPKLENKFRLELMEVLLKNNNWKFENINEYLMSQVVIERDSDGWMELTSPLKIVNYGEDSFASLQGFEINTKTGEISFTLNKQANGVIHNNCNTLTIYDLNEMLEKNIMVANFSLDPVDPNMSYHPFNIMVFKPENLYQTQFLNTMLLTDYILKFLTTGQEVQGVYPYDMRYIKEAIKDLPEHLQKIIFDFNETHSTGSIHRFWIEAEQVTEASLEEDGIYKVALTDVKMVVKKHTMERDHNGKLIDKEKDPEGWDLYILSRLQKTELDEGKRIIDGPAIIFVQGWNKLFFILKKSIYKETNLSLCEMGQLDTLMQYERDINGKVIVTMNNSMFIYNMIKDLAIANQEPTCFSPEYIFAQEFTAHYDEFSKHILEFARLRELSKIAVAMRILNIKKTGTEQKIVNLDKLLKSLPSWEQKDSHESNKDSYLDLPLPFLSEEERDFAVFRNENAEWIKNMLPNNIYKQCLENLTKIYNEIQTMKVDFELPDINQGCIKAFEAKKREYNWLNWQLNKNYIWKQICDEYSRRIIGIKKDQIQDKLYYEFKEGLSRKELSGVKVHQLIKNAMEGDIKDLAEELAKQHFIKAKEQIRQIINDSKKLLEGFEKIGLGTQSRADLELEQECLWVPASVRHHVVENNSLFVYGGVRVIPKINSLDSSNPNFTTTMNNAFHGKGKINLQLFAAKKATASSSSSSSATSQSNSSGNNTGSSNGTFFQYSSGSRNSNNKRGGGNGGNVNSGGTRGSTDFRDGLKLRTEFAFKEAGLLDQSGKLTTKALECAKRADKIIKKGTELGNRKVIERLTKSGEPLENWAKYKTNSVTLGTGNQAEIHFYYNNRTAEVVYEHDFKVKGGFGPKGDDVSLFSRKKPEKEPISQKDPCYRP